MIMNPLAKTVLEHAAVVMCNRKAAVIWMKTPLFELNNQTPTEYLKTARSTDAILKLLDSFKKHK